MVGWTSFKPWCNMRTIATRICRESKWFFFFLLNKKNKDELFFSFPSFSFRFYFGCRYCCCVSGWYLSHITFRGTSALERRNGFEKMLRGGGMEKECWEREMEGEKWWVIELYPYVSTRKLFLPITPCWCYLNEWTWPALMLMNFLLYVGNNPQYTLRIMCKDSLAAVWVLLSRHITTKVLQHVHYFEWNKKVVTKVSTIIISWRRPFPQYLCALEVSVHCLLPPPSLPPKWCSVHSWLDHACPLTWF